jgi:uncharacterized protein YjaZ
VQVFLNIGLGFACFLCIVNVCKQIQFRNEVHAVYQAHQLNVWKEIARQEVLFSKNRTEVQKWFEYGPFTNAENVPQESAPQLGVFMGLQMVKSYMENHPEISVIQLLKEDNAQKILQAYKPNL